MKRYKLLLFDFDGTVIDNEEGILNCIDYSLKKLGLPPLEYEIKRKFIGPSLFDSFVRYCCDDPAQADLFVKYYRERYAPTGHAECRLYDGIKDAAERLAADGYHIAVCSGKPYDFVVKIARLLGIFELFENYFCPGFSSHSSTKDELIAEAGERYGVKKEEILMIGDRCFDIVSAKKAGVASMGVRYGFAEPGELEENGADLIADTVEDVYALIRSTET